LRFPDYGMMSAWYGVRFLFVAVTAAFRLLYVFVVTGHGRRRIAIWA